MRVLIADDHSLFREGLRSLLMAHGIHVVGEAANGREAVELARRLEPDVVLMDLGMPGLDGLTATRQIVSTVPCSQVVILTATESDSDLFEAIRAGARGYLIKDLESDRFFELVEGVVRGEPALTPRLARKLLDEFAHPHVQVEQGLISAALTDRERQILELLVAGVTSNRELAEQLVVSENTVKFHLRNILSKLHLQNRAQVVSHVLRHGLVDVPEDAEPAPGDA